MNLDIEHILRLGRCRVVSMLQECPIVQTDILSNHSRVRYVPCSAWISTLKLEKFILQMKHCSWIV